MTSPSVHDDLRGGIASLRIDDGERNALSPQVLREIRGAFGSELIRDAMRG